MASLGGYYLNPHRSQYEAGSSALTRREGCVPTSGANGANASSGGRVNRSASQVHALIPKASETNPSTPGWSLPDLDHAMAKLAIKLDVRTSSGWAAMISALNAGHYIAAQGDSDQFPNSTCSGDFDGDHCIGIHPARRVINGLTQHWIDDPICGAGRWEYDYVIRRYTSKLAGSPEKVWFADFTTPVARVASKTVVTLRYGGKRITRVAKRISVPRGQKANVRVRPTTASPIFTRLANGQTFIAYQRTTTGQQLAGSAVWYGDRTGTHWLHVTAF